FFTPRSRPLYISPFPYTTLFRSFYVFPLVTRSHRGRQPDRAGENRTGQSAGRSARRGNRPHLGGGPRAPRILRQVPRAGAASATDRKSTRLNSSHVASSYAVFSL